MNQLDYLKLRDELLLAISGYDATYRPTAVECRDDVIRVLAAHGLLRGTIHDPE